MDVRISAVTMAELAAGIHQTVDPAERATRIAVLRRAEATFAPIPFDAEVARMYGLLTAGVIAVGRKPRRREVDLMIAATAAVQDLPLFTTTPDDFLGVESFVTVVPVTRPVEA